MSSAMIAIIPSHATFTSWKLPLLQYDINTACAYYRQFNILTSYSSYSSSDGEGYYYEERYRSPGRRERREPRPVSPRPPPPRRERTPPPRRERTPPPRRSRTPPRDYADYPDRASDLQVGTS